MRNAILLFTTVISFSLLPSGTGAVLADPSAAAKKLSQANKLKTQGNFKDALALYSQLLSGKETPDFMPGSLTNALECQLRLNLLHESDTLVENCSKIFPQNVPLLHEAANYYRTTNHYGTISGGNFIRGGNYRRSGKFVNSQERDCVRSLQLFLQAEKLIPAAKLSEEQQTQFFSDFASALLMGKGGGDNGNEIWNQYETWALQTLSNLEELPDFTPQEQMYFNRESGAPVNPDGSPVYYHLRKSFAECVNDGERWRWVINHIPSNKTLWIKFLKSQFAVETIAERISRNQELAAKFQAEEGIFALRTLNDDETIARLSDGVRRFTLPDEFNFLKLALKAMNHDTVLQEYKNRMQYTKALEYARKFPDVVVCKDTIASITRAEGEFMQLESQPVGIKPTLKYHYRNAAQVQLSARRINTGLLISDIKKYLKSNPLDFNHNNINLSSIGYNMVTKGQDKYLIDAQPYAWTEKLEPGDQHYLRVADLNVPFDQPGAYLIEAKVSDKAKSYIVLWLSDTTILRNVDEGRIIYIATDSRTGKPLENVDFKFFSYNIQYLEKPSGSGENKRRINVVCKEISKKSANGIVELKPDELESGSTVMVETSALGYRGVSGFQGIWYHGYRPDPEYNQRKIYCVSDRPVYRPGQRVYFKAWGALAAYLENINNPYAGAPLQVVITAPDDSKVYEQTHTADRFGGVDGELTLPENTRLGVYNIRISDRGYSSFRVEEYKKPEFEVNISGPSSPVLLGEKFNAEISAKYYFGEPVTHAEVNYKIKRRAINKIFYPVAPWDWLYGQGYWWNNNWNYLTLRHSSIIYPFPVYSPEEVVGFGQLKLDANGKAQVSIDSMPVKQLYGEIDSEYIIEAEVTDASRRQIRASSKIMLPAKPFNVFIWPTRGFYNAGDLVRIQVKTLTPDGKTIKTGGAAKLFRLEIGKSGKSIKKAIEDFTLEQDNTLKFKVPEQGVYKLVCTMTDDAGNSIANHCLIRVVGNKKLETGYQFDDIELSTDKLSYAPGDTVKLLINTKRPDATVMLFQSPGSTTIPEIISMNGQHSFIKEIKVSRKEMPNFFVRACTVSNGKLFDRQLKIIVPPENKVINIETLALAPKVSPGGRQELSIKLSDSAGKALSGQVVVSVYDKALEYIAPAASPDIRQFFWGWQRFYNANFFSNIMHSGNIVPPGMFGLGQLGCFDFMSIFIGDESAVDGGAPAPMMLAAGAPMKERSAVVAKSALNEDSFSAEAAGGAPAFDAVSVRQDFADSAFWAAKLVPDENGVVKIDFKAPENLSTWKVKVWAMDDKARAGQGETEFITGKDFLLRMQTPRFLVESDTATFSANIHNYHKVGKDTFAQISIEGDAIALKNPQDALRRVRIEARGEVRVDWQVKAVREGQAKITMKAVADGEGSSDAMLLEVPVIVHGIAKQIAQSGSIAFDAPDGASAKLSFDLPAERKAGESRVQLNYSPSLAAAVVDALPYLAAYPYGCTEQTLNRFLPTVIARKALKDSGISLPEISDKRTNLNPGELGDDRIRAQQWRRLKTNPVFDPAEIDKMLNAGLRKLNDMQNRDGGWGWFYGFGEDSYPHTTAQVVRGLLKTLECGVQVDQTMLDNGVAWLEKYQLRQLELIENDAKRKSPAKSNPDNIDAFVFKVLSSAGKSNDAMRELLYTHRDKLSVYGKALFALGLTRLEATPAVNTQLQMLMDNISQYLKVDNDTQNAWLDMQGTPWWYWYGSDTEAMAVYLRLLCLRGNAADMKNASMLAKYLLNNRKHASYWNSTRDTALCVEALCAYMIKSGETSPDMTLEIKVDGKTRKTVSINHDNLFSFDSSLILYDKDLKTGKLDIELIRTGRGAVYYNAYMSYFSLEKFITRAGLDVKIDRNYYRLTESTATAVEKGKQGAVSVERERFIREKVNSPAEFNSGDLIEVELIVQSTNDYEYIVLRDAKPAGGEAVNVRSGYIRNAFPAYAEYRDREVCFFLRTLPRGSHSLSYRLRAETPGSYSALPARAEAMYAPELKANSDEFKLSIGEQKKTD